MNIEKKTHFVWSDVKNIGTKDGIDTTFSRAIFFPQKTVQYIPAFSFTFSFFLPKSKRLYMKISNDNEIKLN